MQELLTGKRRLPGFESKWKKVKLCDLLNYERPDKYIVSNTDYSQNGNTPVITANKSFVLGFTEEDFNICNDFPVILFDDFTTDKKYVDFPFKVKSSAIKLLRSKSDQNDLQFLFFCLQLVKFPIGDHKRYYISEYQYIEIEVPSPEEQLCIISVLKDEELEITLLERKLEKLRKMKHGMMRSLLTGRIRLV